MNSTQVSVRGYAASQPMPGLSGVSDSQKVPWSSTVSESFSQNTAIVSSAE